MKTDFPWIKLAPHPISSSVTTETSHRQQESLAYIFLFRLKCSKKLNKQVIFEALYLDLEDLKQSDSWGEGKKAEREESPTLFIKSLLGTSVPPTHAPTHPRSDFWPTVLSREQWGYSKSDPGGQCLLSYLIFVSRFNPSLNMNRTHCMSQLIHWK